MEFAPDGRFEDRRSLVAHEQQRPQPFAKVSRKAGEVRLETGALTVISRENDRAFFRGNLEVRWVSDGLLQYWRPGDRDHRNLGGTVRSLDRFGDQLAIAGVHVADTEPPDAKASEWLAWLQCEDDPWYYEQSPEKRPGLNGDFLGSVRHGLHNLLARTWNWTVDHLKYSPGVLSRSGYFLLNDSTSPVMDEADFPVERNRPGCEDWYFFGYGTEYRTALADFIRLTGRAPLPTRNTFGLIFSRWPAYDEAEARRIVQEFADHGVPLSTLVVDMEWHKEGWGHWDWDPARYPDPAAFFEWCHARGLAVTLNDHPLDVRSDDSHFKAYLKAAGTARRVRRAAYNGKSVDMVDVNICDKREARAFLEVCHAPIVRQGLDFWWNDGCRGRLNGAINQLVCSKLCFEEVAAKDRRGMLLARYGGLGSHRYGVFFTGDTLSCWEVLAMQCEFNIRAGHLGLAYISHDMGGFFTAGQTRLLDQNLFLRWIQFGVFNPVFRFHSAPGSGSRKPWDYGEYAEKIAARWLRLRNSLVPYVYTAAREHHDTGVPIVRGLFLDRPNDESAYRFDEFLFGPSLLVAPILAADSYRDVYLPAGRWYRFETCDRIEGGRVLTERSGPGGIPVYVPAGSIVVRQDPDSPPGCGHVGDLLLDVYPGKDAEAELYEDDGRSPDYLKGAACRTRFVLAGEKGRLTLSGRPPEGRPLGERRRVTVHLSLPAAPKKVVLDGKVRLSCEPLGTAGRWRIVLPERAAGRGFKLVLTTASGK